MNETYRCSHCHTPFHDLFTLSGVIDHNAEGMLLDIPKMVSAPLVKIDFGEVSRINSMGIALLLRCLKRLRDERHADIRLLSLNQVNMMLFRMTGVFLLAKADDA